VIPCFCRHDLSAANLPEPAPWAGAAAVPVDALFVLVELVAELPQAASATQATSSARASAGRRRRL
jgi:hypothetical protein